MTSEAINSMMSNIDNRLLFIIRNWSHKLVVPEIYWKHHIDFGYRQPFLKFSRVFFSLFDIHNETMNIWTHLIGFFFAIYTSCYYLIENIQVISNHVLEYNKQLLFSNDINNNTLSDQRYKTIEVICFSAFTFSACSCLLFSTLFHWFACLSPKHFDTLLKLDHLGIALTIGSSYFPGVYFGFYCHPELQTIYLCMAATVFAMCLVTPFVNFQVGSMSAQTFTFALLVVFGLVPTTHWCLVSPAFYRDQVILGFIGMFGFYGFGFLFYGSCFPECSYPKRYWSTMLIPSHALWHVCILLAMYCWYSHLRLYQSLLGEHGCTPYQ